MFQHFLNGLLGREQARADPHTQQCVAKLTLRLHAIVNLTRDLQCVSLRAHHHQQRASWCDGVLAYAL